MHLIKLIKYTINNYQFLYIYIYEKFNIKHGIKLFYT